MVAGTKERKLSECQLISLSKDGTYRLEKRTVKSRTRQEAPGPKEDSFSQIIRVINHAGGMKKRTKPKRWSVVRCFLG